MDYEVSYLEEYKKKISPEPIPLYEVMGNEYFENFDYNPEAVYKYCLENNVRWEKVLHYNPDPRVIY